MDGSEEVLKNWDALKRESKHQDTFTETLESVPNTFPALLRGEKICKRASRAGYPMNSAKEFADRIRANLDMLEANGFEVNSQNQQTCGKMLLDFCNLDRILKIDGEKALTYASNAFIINFSRAEKMAAEKGKKLDEMSEDELAELMKVIFDGQ